MLAIDLVRFCGEMLKRLSDCDILLDDYKRVGMCDEYCKLIDEGHKKEYAIAVVTSIDQWFDSMTHEVDHLQWEIMQYYDVDPGTEEAAWLQGYIVRMIIKAIAR